MLRRVFVAAGSLVIVVSAVSMAAEAPEPSWPFLSRATIGADRFVSANPEWDGRGVLIAVLDTGVALGLPGLDATSDGETKILDVRVFTDEDRIDLEPAELGEDEHGSAVYAGDGRWLYGLEGVTPGPGQGAELLVGYFDEAAFKTAAVDDLNANGRTDDVFGLVAFPPTEGEDWLAVLDTDADGDLSDETPVRDYAVARQWFHLGGNDPHADADPVGYALNLWPDENAAALYFDGGAHGTHVAGIAAGHGINGQPGYDGIAPGARIIAGKIGNNTLTGGATGPGSMIRAWRWAVERAAELDMPLVIQMSYGIGSELEGRAEAERLIDTLLEEHPEVAATVSAGNDGPGLSTVGLPSCAGEPFAVAALLAADTAHAVYGADPGADRVFYFSSRGGEMAKPTFACPGFAASTVPDYTGGRDVMRGTSMAAPQGAGACALLYSAAVKSGLPIRRDLLRAALTRSARPLPPYGPLDIGAGVVDVPAAWEVYRALAERPETEPVRYAVTTESPDAPGGEGETVFYRGAFYPTGQDLHEVTIEAVFPDDATEGDVDRFYRALDLECGADWVEVDRPSTYLKQDRSASFSLSFDPDRLQAPGLYQTRIEAYDRRHGRSERRRLGPELVVPVVVAVPFAFDGDGSVSAAIQRVRPSVTSHAFFTVEPWMGSFDIEVELDDDSRDLGALVAAFDPEGREVTVGRIRGDDTSVSRSIPQHRLVPGVWEVTVTGAIANRRPVSAELTARTMPWVRAVGESAALGHDVGEAPSTTTTVVSALDEVWRGRVSGEVIGVVRTDEVEVNGPTYQRTLRAAPEEGAIELRLEIDTEDWGLFTDVAVQVVDADGAAVAQTGFVYRLTSLRVPAGGSGALTLKILGAPADPEADPTWTLRVTEIHRYREPVPVKRDELVLYPFREAELALELERTPPAAPEGTEWLAAIDLEPSRSGEPAPALELRLEPRAGD